MYTDMFTTEVKAQGQQGETSWEEVQVWSFLKDFRMGTPCSFYLFSYCICRVCVKVSLLLRHCLAGPLFNNGRGVNQTCSRAVECLKKCFDVNFDSIGAVWDSETCSQAVTQSELQTHSWNFSQEMLFFDKLPTCNCLHAEGSQGSSDSSGKSQYSSVLVAYPFKAHGWFSAILSN